MAGSRRGFGSMSEEKQREIARKGGQAGHAKGTAHKFTPEEAREAGRKGGMAVSRDREHMAAIARGGRRDEKGQRDQQRERGGRSGRTDEAGGADEAQRTQGDGDRPQERNTPAEGAQTATELLRTDHERVKGLFQEYERADDEELDQKESLAQKAFTELDIHTRIEEELFYPAVREQTGEVGQELVDEGLEEHQAVKELIAELRSMSLTDDEDDDYDGKFQDLLDNVLHHAEEEETEMFPLVEEKMGDSLEYLGAEMAERKRQLISSAQVS
jgi:general stress protein YciG/hemerythrin superfamily protein